jgi:threonine dehydrogenase-like Zn-dependent dehydrogenase
VIKGPTDALIKITSTSICGSDLHLYETLTAFMGEGDIMATGQWASWRRSATGS